MHPSAKELRWFGSILFAFLVTVGGIARFQFDAPTVSLAIWAFGVALCGSYALARPLRRPVYLVWVYMTLPIGWVLSLMLLGVVYFAVVTPIAVVLRLVRGEPLARKPDSTAGSYWELRAQEQDLRRYFKQF